MLAFEEIVAGKGTFRIFGEYRMKDVADRIACRDGVSLSVQAGRLLYSHPQDDDGPYEAVEVGFPSVSPPDSWQEYFDGDWDAEDHTGSVYGYVPVELVREFIELHGGEDTAPVKDKATVIRGSLLEIDFDWAQ